VHAGDGTDQGDGGAAADAAAVVEDDGSARVGEGDAEGGDVGTLFLGQCGDELGCGVCSPS